MPASPPTTSKPHFQHSWVIAAWLIFLLLAFAVGLGYLADYGADYDEGALLQTAVLAHDGYALYDPVVLNKPPLLVWWGQFFFTPARAASQPAGMLYQTVPAVSPKHLVKDWCYLTTGRIH